VAAAKISAERLRELLDYDPDKKRRWCAFITVNYKSMLVGRFRSPQEAHEAYLMAAEKHFGAFARQ
jgi:hypothetical protein